MALVFILSMLVKWKSLNLFLSAVLIFFMHEKNCSQTYVLLDMHNSFLEKVNNFQLVLTLAPRINRFVSAKENPVAFEDGKETNTTFVFIGIFESMTKAPWRKSQPLIAKRDKIPAFYCKRGQDVSLLLPKRKIIQASYCKKGEYVNLLLQKGTESQPLIAKMDKILLS